MNQEQFNGQLRTFLASALAFYAAKYLPPDLLNALPQGWAPVVVAFLAGLPSAIWSAWAKRPHALAQQAIAVLQDKPLLATKVSNALAPSPAPTAPQA